MKSQGLRFFIAVITLISAINSAAFATESDLHRQLREVVHDYLKSNYPDLQNEILQLDVINEPNLRVNQYKFQVMVRQGQSFLGRFSVPIRYLDANGKIVGTDVVRCQTQIVTTVWTATKPIPKGVALSSNNCVSRNIAINGDSINSVKLKQSLSECWAARPIAKGQVIQSWMVGAPPVVRAGDNIKVKVIGENVEISVPGVALEDGKIGDTIRIRNVTYQKVVVGNVEDSQNAVVRVSH